MLRNYENVLRYYENVLRDHDNMLRDHENVLRAGVNIFHFAFPPGKKYDDLFRKNTNIRENFYCTLGEKYDFKKRRGGKKYQLF